MTAPLVSEADFCRLFSQHGATAMAKLLQTDERTIYARRRKIENRTGRPIVPPTAIEIDHPERIKIKIDNGVVLVGSDAHIWPGSASTGIRAFTKFCKDMKPAAAILNGDVTDFPKISRHPPIGWNHSPAVVEELEACGDQLGEIEKAVGRGRKLWPLGNHDARFETKLASVSPEFMKVRGTSLSDHFPLWEPCWAVWINDDVIIKHRFKGGIHATHNNTMWAGKTMVTGHLHSLKVTPFSDYNGTRFGVDGGCLADTYGPQFRDYTEDNPRNWRSGFIVLTFHKARLLWPEVVHVIDRGHVEWRGEVLAV